VDDEYFGSDEVTRGYEYAKGQYVTLDENDFKKVPVRTGHAIDILCFVEAQEIDPVYYRDSYYLEPEELAAKPFTLLTQALQKTKRYAVAKVTFQRREHLCCLRPLNGILALHTMYYHDEILPWKQLVPPEQAVSSEEMDMASTLVKAMAKEFAPQEYRDEYRVALQGVIEAKIKGEEIKVPKAPKVEVMDLMAALKASVEVATRESAAKEKLRELAATKGQRKK